MRQQLPDEAQLLLCCTRTVIDQAASNFAVHLARKSLNWPQVMQYAATHQVIPLFHHGLIQTCEEHVPASVLSDLKNLSSEYIDRNKTSTKLLLRILALLDSNEIPAIPFKGITFAIAHYGNVELRQCGDIDVLVQRHHFLKAKDLLIREGFSQIYFGHHEAATVQAQLVRNENKDAIDLHYGITPHYYPNISEAEAGSRLDKKNWNKGVDNLTYWHFYFDPDPMWSRLVSLDVAGKKVLVFAPEDCLVVASIQGVKDLWLNLRRICDVAELLRANPRLDWDFVLSEVRALNFEKKFFLGIQLAHRLLGAPVDEAVLRAVHKYPIVSGITEQTSEMLFKTNNELDRLGYRFSSNLLTMDTFRDRFRYFLYAVSQFSSGNRIRLTLRRYRRFLHMLLTPYLFLIRSGAR